MKKQLWKKFLTVFLTLGVIISLINPAYIVSADDNNGLIGGRIDPVIPNWDFTVSTTNASFGQVTEGDDYCGSTTSITLLNTGNVLADVIWSEYDPNDFFSVDAPDNTSLKVGERSDYYFILDGYLPAGNYSGSVVFSLQEDQSKSICVDVSVSVVPGEPIVYDVDVYPVSAEVSKGGSIQFSAYVDGYNLRSYDVNWKVENNKSSNTRINSDGYLTIGNDESSDSISVVATAKDDPNIGDAANVSIKSNYYSVTVRADEGGQVSGGGSVKGGDSIELFASPNNGYDFDGWYENNNKFSSDKKIKINNVSSDRNFVAKFKRRLAYVVTSSSPEKAGTTSGDGYYNVGDKVTVKATPKSGYRFVCWKIDNQVVSKEKEYTLTNLNGEYRLTACFEACEFDVKACITPDQGGKVDGAGRYKENTNAVLKATPSNGYTFKGWFVDSKLYSDKDTIVIEKVTKDYCFVAAFEKKAAKAYSMISKAGNGGVIVPAGNYSVVENVTVTYLITANDGYKIKDVTVDGKSVGAVSSYSFANVNNNHDISVTFEKKDTVKSQKSDEHKKDDVQNIAVKPTGNSVSDSKAERKSISEEEKEKIEAEIQDANEDVNYDNLTGLLQKYNMTPDEAYMHLYDEVGEALFDEAYRDGTISFVVNNEYAPNTQATATNEFFENPSIPNYWDILDDCITDEEAVEVLKGTTLQVHVDITDMSKILDDGAKEEIYTYAKENNLDVGNIFDITMLRTYHDVISSIKELDVDAEIVLAVPEDLQSKATEFKIIHIHDDGNKEILDDLDDNPATVTFKTRTFSNFAFAYGNGGNEKVDSLVKDNVKPTMLNKVILICVALVAAIILTVVLLLLLNMKNSKHKNNK